MKMLGIILALLTALAFSSSTILVRKRLDESDFFIASLVIVVIGNIILWPLALLFTNWSSVNLEGALIFFIAGILGPGIASLIYFKGMEVVGVSVNAAINATHPMYSSIFAVLLLGEVIAPENWVGIVCIVVGVVFTERSLNYSKNRSKRISKRGLFVPLLTSLTVALAFTLRKHGLNIYNEPLLGVAIGHSSSFLLYFLVLISSRARTRGLLFSGKDFRLFWKAGVCMSLGWISAFYALSHERVSIVTPLMQTQPLFILFFAYLYLKDLEHISFTLITSTLLIVIGAMLVSSS